ncbi:MAG: hypothetical protein COB12_00025 [Flavobacterium sp.]|nr:MAG: hypothetical protein COB12_00025 [Flavobacterium sp.]
MSYFSNLLKSEYSKNVLTLMTGTTIAQAIPIAITPILTRIYSPNDFGVFALFLALTAIAGAVSNAQYEQAIVLPVKDEDSFNLVALGITIALSFSLFLLIIVLLFKDQISVLFGNSQIAPFLFLVPLSTLLAGIYNSLNLFNIRKKQFKNIAISQVTRSSSLGVSQVLIGLISFGPVGLVIGQIISYFSGNVMLFKTLKSNYKKNYISVEKIKHQATIYKKFPIYSLPSILLNSINLNVVNFLISSIFSITTLGFYSLTQRIIGIPSKVIGNSFSQVYLQKASESLKKTGSTKVVFKKTFLKLTYLSIPIFTILFFIVEPLFAFVFGEEWGVSGTYAKILIPLAAVRFVSSSLSNTLVVHQKQQYGLLINLFLLTSTMVIYLYSKSSGIIFIDTLKYFSIIMILEYSLFTLLYWQISNKKPI